MSPIDRRRLLGLAAGFGTALAGCVGGNDPGGSGGDPGDGSNEGPTTGDGSATDGPTATDGGTPDPELTDVESIQLGPAVESPEYSEEFVGRTTLISSPERADAILDLDALPEDRRERVRAFVDGTDFERSLLVLVQSVGPDACYREVEVSDAEVSDGRVRFAARAVDASDGDRLCAQSITFPAAIVRVTVDGPVPSRATVRITDGWGNEETVETASEGPIDPADLDGYVRPDGDPPVVRDPLTCDREGFERLGSWVDEDELAWGEATAGDGDPVFALRVDALEAEYGDTVSISMTNVSGEERGTGNRHKYNLQAYTDDGWQDVRGVTDSDPVGYTDEGILHEPGEGFEWELELTEEGLVADHSHADRLVVCPDLTPGRYRFVYWEPAVAVAFDLVE
ncbi:hypothetical protein [Halomicrobium urmianum]|uniref:hypothetical protein n=1 Tax=Halomicrobium urmianum TaxID=1586233 RepID=UPI001CDA34B3|nr:hypothetical protein [Halomicrobium urmianum]